MGGVEPVIQPEHKHNPVKGKPHLLDLITEPGGRLSTSRLQSWIAFLVIAIVLLARIEASETIIIALLTGVVAQRANGKWAETQASRYDYPTRGY